MRQGDPTSGKGANANEPLQLALVPMPAWVGDEKGGQFRPTLSVLVGAHSRLALGVDIGSPLDAPFDVAARLLAKTPPLLRARGPVHVQVRDPELATALSARKELADFVFQPVDMLQAADELLAHMYRDLFPNQSGSPLEGKGMSVERLGAFADAAAAFYAAQPWKQLHDDDVIEIQSPKPPAGLKITSILGAGGQVMGIGFFPSLDAHRALEESDAPLKNAAKNPRWALMFHGPDEVPPEDADLWQQHGLHVTADESVPELLRYHGTKKVERPDAEVTTFVEGLCRALAQTSEAEIDSGRWEKTVQTFDGPAVYRLTIPHLLQKKAPPTDFRSGRAMMEQKMQQVLRMMQRTGAQSMEEINALLEEQVNGKAPQDLPPMSDKERAQDLIYEAQQVRSRRQLQLIREALRLDPDCADAYVLLANRQSDPAEAEKLYRQAVEAGRRAVGEEAFDDPEYPFWGALESRPFMRALSGLADVVAAQDRRPEAAEIWAQMLRLNPGDNQGVRYQLLPALIFLNRLEEARSLAESADYRDDDSALWNFGAALIAFKQGRTDDADRLLNGAIKRNRHVAPLLLDPEQLPPISPDSWSPGAPSEAVMVGELLEEAWNSDEAALAWLASAAKPKRGTRAQGPKKKGKRK